jgi:hypothetical protein
MWGIHCTLSWPYLNYPNQTCAPDVICGSCGYISRLHVRNVPRKPSWTWAHSFYRWEWWHRWGSRETWPYLIGIAELQYRTHTTAITCASIPVRYIVYFVFATMCWTMSTMCSPPSCFCILYYVPEHLLGMCVVQWGVRYCSSALPIK